MVIVCNWRRYFFVVLLLVLIISSVAGQAPELEAGWWVEQERLPPVSWQTVRRTVRPSRWTGWLRSIVRGWQAKAGRILLLKGGQAVLSLVVGLLWLLQWVTLQQVKQGAGSVAFGWSRSWEKEVATAPVELRLVVLVSAEVRGKARVEPLQLGPTSGIVLRQTEGQSIEKKQAEATGDRERPAVRVRPKEIEKAVEVRVLPGGQRGWAKHRQAQVKAKIGEEAYQCVEGLIRWCLGEKVTEIVAGQSVKRSGFYYRLEQTLERLPAVLADGRRHNGRKGSGVDKKIAERVVEMVVGQPGIRPEEVSRRLVQQDGSRVSPEKVTDYLGRAQLGAYQSSPYRPGVLPEDTDCFSRYAGHLLQVSSWEQLGFYQAAPLLDVTEEGSYYSHLVRCHTVLLALSSGKSRLYHTGELVEAEVGLVLGESRYPQSSDLHAYFDRIVRQDQRQAEQGVPLQERLVEQFVRQAQQGVARSAGPGAGSAIYVDPHVIALHTAKAVARTKHGVQKRVVKALVKLSAVSASRPGHPLVFQLGQGDLSFRATLEQIVDLTSWSTGEAVEVVAIDRGGLSQAVLERFEERGIGLLVWSENSSTMGRSLAAVEKSAFRDAEYKPVHSAGGQKVKRLKSRVADVPEMVINGDGYRCRTIVVEACPERSRRDVKNGHRVGIHAVGQPSRELTAHQILALMRGKQWIEEDFKQAIAWGSDAFCGGEISEAWRRAQPSPVEVETLKAKARALKGRWQANLAEEGAAVAEWQNGTWTKRQLNDLLNGIRRRRKRIEADWQETEGLIKWGVTGRAPKSQQLWRVDIRKMLLMSQFQDFARVARRHTMSLVRRCLKQALFERELGKLEPPITREQQQMIEQETEKALDRIPWGQLETRLFEQGGWIHKDRQQRVMSVTLRPFKQPLMQRACELLCTHLNQQQPVMRCQDGEYILHYACSPP